MATTVLYCKFLLLIKFICEMRDFKEMAGIINNIFPFHYTWMWNIYLTNMNTDTKDLATIYFHLNDIQL